MPQNILALIYVLISMLSIQFGASIAKRVFPIAGPAGTTMLRVSLAAIILLLMWKPWRVKWEKKRLLNFCYYGLSLGAMNLFFYLSLARIPLGIAVALEFTGPLTLALISSKKISDIVWALLAAVGIYFILPISDTAHALDLTGIAFAFLAGVCWALYIIFGKASTANVHSGHATALGMTFAALLTLPFGIVMNGAQIFDFHLMMTLLPLGVLIAILSSALPYSLEMMALKNIPTKTFGILLSLEPAFATLMGYLFLKEKLSTLQIFSIVCIVIASTGATFSGKSEQESKILSN
jgi:inner membrane transporter RhtA